MVRTSPKQFEELSNNFDKIDKNGDGINITELSSYAKSQGISIPSGNFPASRRNWWFPWWWSTSQGDDQRRPRRYAEQDGAAWRA